MLKMSYRKMAEIADYEDSFSPSVNSRDTVITFDYFSETLFNLLIANDHNYVNYTNNPNSHGHNKLFGTRKLELEFIEKHGQFNLL